MRLNVSPKVALDKIDKLVREGELLIFKLDDFMNYGEVEIPRKKYKMKSKKLDLWIHKNLNQYEFELAFQVENAPKNFSMSKRESEQVVNFINQRAINWQKGLQSPSAPEAYLREILNYNTELLSIEREDHFATIVNQYSEWAKKTIKTLKKIYSDHIPIFKFKYLKVDTSNLDPETGLYENIKKRAEVLIELYDDLKNFSRSPLFYIPDEAKLCFYEIVIELKKDTNESQLCKFLFSKEIGKVFLIESICDFIFPSSMEKEKHDLRKIKNATDSINKKTRKYFGFQIITKLSKESELRVVLPPHIVRTWSKK
jgi:hypothetical protein